MRTDSINERGICRVRAAGDVAITATSAGGVQGTNVMGEPARSPDSTSSSTSRASASGSSPGARRQPPPITDGPVSAPQITCIATSASVPGANTPASMQRWMRPAANASI